MVGKRRWSLLEATEFDAKLPELPCGTRLVSYTHLSQTIIQVQRIIIRDPFDKTNYGTQVVLFHESNFRLKQS